MPRQNDSQRAARDYMQAHPGTSYRQALAIVTGKSVVTPAVQGVVLEGYAEGWSNADLNALIATMGELVREGALEPYTDILSSRQIEVAEKCHDLWVEEHTNDNEDDNDTATVRVEVVGRISARSLKAALYGGWEIESLTEHDDDTLTAVIVCPASMADSGFGVRPQSDRIRSFGGVRVTDITGMSEYHVHLSLSYEEETGVGGVTIHAATLDDACEQASARYGENVVLVEGPDGTREML